MKASWARDRLLWVAIALLAIALHLPAHLGWGAGPKGREPLYEDGPAFVSNPAFEAFGTQTFGDVLGRAVSDPGAAWAEGDGVVGLSRNRPLASAAFAVERRAFGRHAAVGAGVVSLALHVAVALLTLKLLGDLGLSRGARALGAGVVAASPAALAVAAWPAHQGTVLAAALALGGVVVGLRGGWARLVAAGALIAVAGLAHEMALAAALALPMLGRESPTPGVRTPSTVGRWAVALALPAVVAARVPLLAVDPASPWPGASEAIYTVFDPFVGIVHGFATTLIPARLHFADGPAATTGFAAIGAVAVLAAVIGLRGSARTGSRLALAGIAALLPVALLGLPRMTTGSRFQDGAVYLATPYVAGAVAWTVAAALARQGAIRIAAAVAGALWLGVHVTGSATRAAGFRTRAGHLALAAEEMPRSPVVEAWSLDAATGAASRDADGGKAALRDLVARARALGAQVTDEVGAHVIARDPVAALTIAASLARCGAAAVRSGPPPGDALYEAVEPAVAAACEISPRWVTGWLVLTSVRDRAGMLRDAFESAQRAASVAPDDPDVMSNGVRAALALGLGDLAATLAEDMREAEFAQAEARGRPVRPGLLLLFAHAVAADGRTRVIDAFVGPGVHCRYEGAVAALRQLIARGELVAEAKAELARVCLTYGDVLATEDRTALALAAYAEAAATGSRDPEIAEHQRWLVERLDADVRRAESDLQRAAAGEGSIADAMVQLANAYARRGDFGQAREVFARLETDIGLTPPLRAMRAMHLLRETDPALAADELAKATAEDPTLARARFERAKILEEHGADARALGEAISEYREARRAALSQVETSGAEEWMLDAVERSARLESLLRAAENPSERPPPK